MLFQYYCNIVCINVIGSRHVVFKNPIAKQSLQRHLVNKAAALTKSLFYSKEVKFSNKCFQTTMMSLTKLGTVIDQPV